MNTSTLSLLRKVGFAEGISFLILLLIAMPLKYMMDMPLAVKITGSAHGALFVIYVGLAYYAKEVYQWPFNKFLMAFMAAWLPLGTFFFDARLKKDQEILSRK
jgi:integral membrane protein